jgi:hypothetical protein
VHARDGEHPSTSAPERDNQRPPVAQDLDVVVVEFGQELPADQHRDALRSWSRARREEASVTKALAFKRFSVGSHAVCLLQRDDLMTVRQHPHQPHSLSRLLSVARRRRLEERCGVPRGGVYGEDARGERRGGVTVPSSWLSKPRSASVGRLRASARRRIGQGLAEVGQVGRRRERDHAVDGLAGEEAAAGVPRIGTRVVRGIRRCRACRSQR